jgi:hypothetical protein
MDTLVVRRCFRDTVFRQSEGESGRTTKVNSILTTIKAEFHSPEVHELLARYQPVQGSRVGAHVQALMAVQVLRRYVQLLFVIADADTVLGGIVSREAELSSLSLIRYVQNNWLRTENWKGYNSHSFFAQGILLTQNMLARVLWICGLALGRDRYEDGVSLLQCDVLMCSHRHKVDLGTSEADWRKSHVKSVGALLGLK